MNHYGRKKIKTDVDVITPDNIMAVLNKALTIHRGNSLDIQYLWDVYRGKQEILNKVKQIRPEINNKVVINRANEIANFKSGYLLGEPLQYISRNAESSAEAINQLNEFMAAEEKASKDKELADWFHICGTAYRMVLPANRGAEDKAPFEIYTLDPRYSFVVYHNGLGEKPVMGVMYVVNELGHTIYSCYTETDYFEIDTDTIVKHEGHMLGEVPIVEYPLDIARLGSYEVVITILNAINNLESNRMDSVEQFVQALLLLHNVNLSKEQYDELRERGAIKFTDIDPQLKGEITYLCETLNQTETQTLADSMYQTVLTICGMPSQGDGSTGDSSNNGAVILKNGWQSAEARAKDSELSFKRSERQFLRLVLKICKVIAGMNLKVSDVDIRFTRRNYENILQKTQVLTMMLDNEKVANKLAFEHCGMFPDSDLAYSMSEEEYEKNRKRNLEEMVKNNGNSGINTSSGRDDRGNLEKGQQSRSGD